MKFSIPFLATALYATSAFSAPSGDSRSRLARRIDRRQGFTRLTHPLIPLGSADVEGTKNFATDAAISHVEYSSNWAGAVYESPPSGQTFKSVTAQIKVPTPSAPSSSAGTYAASAWVGIDGDTYGNAILQTGVDFYATKSGSSTRVSFDAWYEWYPDYAYDFSGFTVSAGDTIQMTVTASSLSAGTAVLENLTTGKTVTKSLTAPSSSSKLGGQNAEWIVEDFQSGNSQVPFANFGTVLFTGASAQTSGGTTEGTSGATIIEIQNSSGQVITDVTIPSNSEVQVTYV